MDPDEHQYYDARVEKIIREANVNIAQARLDLTEATEMLSKLRQFVPIDMLSDVDEFLARQGVMK